MLSSMSTIIKRGPQVYPILQESPTIALRPSLVWMIHKLLIYLCMYDCSVSKRILNNLVLGRPPQWWYVCTAGVQQGLEGVQQRLEGLHKQLKQNNYQLRLNQTSRTSQVGSRIIVDASNSSVKSSINNSINCFYKLRGSMRSRRGPKTNSWSRRQHRVGRSRSSSSSSSSSDPSDSVPREQDRIFKVIDKDQVCMDLGCVFF